MSRACRGAAAGGALRTHRPRKSAPRVAGGCVPDCRLEVRSECRRRWPSRRNGAGVWPEARPAGFSRRSSERGLAADAKRRNKSKRPAAPRRGRGATRRAYAHTSPDIILERARLNGRVSVDALAEALSVSVQTIRKDINELCDLNFLSRVHGGAVIASGVENVGYDARRFIASAEKAAIGRAVAALVPNQSSLFVNIGTTTEAAARALLGHTGLMVITNNLNVAHLMRPAAGIEVIVAGGVVRRSDGGIVGEAAVDFIHQFKVDHAVIGVSAIDPDGSLLDFDYREVRVAQAIIANARHVILASDASKFERDAPVRFGHFSQIDTFVTDRCPPAIRRICEEASVRVVEVGAEVEEPAEADAASD